MCGCQGPIQSVAAATLLTLVPALLAAGTAEMTWQQEPGQSIALVGPQGCIWQFNYGPQATKPYFHPVATSTGVVLTASQPADHPWHYGLWFCWKYINGVNYWEESRIDGKAAGRTEWRDVRIETDDDGSARIEMKLTYRPADGEIVLEEERLVQISSANPKSYYLDWQSKFTVGAEDVILDRTPFSQEPGGQAWGGYAGLSVRFSETLARRRVTSMDGPVVFDRTSRYRGSSPACDYSGEVGEITSGGGGGIAILDHPRNPRHPTPWYAIRSNMSYLNAALLTHASLEIKARESLTLRYRVIVHPGCWDQDTLQTEHERYRVN